MIRRRRLIITPGPGRQLPDPEDPSLPQVSPHQPEPQLPPPPDAPPSRRAPTDPPPDDDEPRSASHSAHTQWLQALGVETDRDSRRAWLEPHLWAALRARVDAGAAERRARWHSPGPAPLFR